MGSSPFSAGAGLLVELARGLTRNTNKGEKAKAPPFVRYTLKYKNPDSVVIWWISQNCN
jgi:hypothetical protein